MAEPLEVRVHSSIGEVPAEQWNALVEDGNPLVRHEFLGAMERHGCVGEAFGWLPRHLGVYDGERLLGAMPLYEKHNSYGEFVFDHAWVDAFRRTGLAYYPKLVSAVPYTPATGQRLLTRPADQDRVYPLLLGAALQLAEQIGASGFHCLFPLPQEQAFMQRQNLLTRHDCQFHWHNQGYADFDQFLTRLSAKKRKNIRQERRRVSDAGVSLQRFDGHSAGDAEWAEFTRFYERTFEQKWGVATFNEGFFREVGRRLPRGVLLVLAELGGRYIAGALMYVGDTTLYGRHWGAEQQIDSLHFETCYYQGIEFAIKRGLERFEPGAQGEHKIARGFLPTRTLSSHWILDPRFRQPIQAYVEHEQAAIADYMRNLTSALPYKVE